MPLVSFIVPVYNIPAGMLHECIDSILSLPLACEEREIIVVDDGSDVPVEQIDGTTLLRQDNGGLSAARNAALDIATGEWVEFVDADDYLLPSWKSAMPHLHDKTLTVIRMSIESDGDGERRTTAFRHLCDDNLQAAVCRYIFRRSVIGAVRFTRGILHEDEEFTPLVLSQAAGMMLLERRCYYYRRRSDSIMHRPDARHVARRLNDAEGVLLRLHGLHSPLLQRRVSQLTMDYVYNSLRLERSFVATRQRVKRLREYGLWPLPRVKATWKYALFRIAGACCLG